MGDIVTLSEAKKMAKSDMRIALNEKEQRQLRSAKIARERIVRDANKRVQDANNKIHEVTISIFEAHNVPTNWQITDDECFLQPPTLSEAGDKK